jgi:hypothetical protein
VRLLIVSVADFAVNVLNAVVCGVSVAATKVAPTDEALTLMATIARAAQCRVVPVAATQKTEQGGLQSLPGPAVSSAGLERLDDFSRIDGLVSVDEPSTSGGESGLGVSSSPALSSP